MVEGWGPANSELFQNIRLGKVLTSRWQPVGGFGVTFAPVSLGLPRLDSRNTLIKHPAASSDLSPLCQSGSCFKGHSGDISRLYGLPWWLRW